jgi:hypothetical protein
MQFSKKLKQYQLPFRGWGFFFLLFLFSCGVRQAIVKPLPKDVRCYQLPDPGRCKAYMPSYYYDSISGKCKEFIYGGCGGSRPFITLEDCEKTCGCDRKKSK